MTTHPIPDNQTCYIDRTLYTGRPSDISGRPEKEIRTYDLLDSLHVPYQRLDHDAMPTIEACHEVDKLLGIEICKNLFLRNAQKTDFYLLMMPGNKKFKTAILSKQIGSARLSFAEAEFMEQFLDITPGSVSVLGLMNDKEHRVRLLIDKDVLENHEYIGCHPCINTSSLRLRTRDLLDKILPAIGHPYTLVDLPYTEA
ncbi:prolyl-tRNA synthetase associated domain-containing protein [Lacrimispora sp. 210928-DFI.3.58]|uniref:prolyl-tRNA synthetase associated domain-containing protein n=1 Tax=Lacrimispora sp. 210928-DFI.3.58 TaxID=2883214 RepID=UPI0015B50E3F|nr:prolyl-tRNA synthetase associated domain-containing protein [Lacrimispora sp. 210928-DFI.3.58]MCB7320321.1 prolyl-tRNA synthetase associated domain-containing protein [Lacrimispora sp. 210928-DFI.3.58]